jgi:hypothetical protein
MDLNIVTLTEEFKLKVSENIVIRRIFAYKKVMKLRVLEHNVTRNRTEILKKKQQLVNGKTLQLPI